MGRVSRVAKRLARGVADQVAARARNAELFEKPGDRAPSGPPVGAEDREGPLIPGEAVDDGLFDAPDPVTVETVRPAPAEPASAEVVEIVEGGVRVVDLDQLKATIAAVDRPVVLHHWATWCDACIDELPDVDTLVERVGEHAQVLGISWELFERFGKEEFQIVGAVAQYASENELRMPTLVYRGEPDALFSELGLTFEQIPQTRVIDTSGSELRYYKGPMSEDDVSALVDLLASTD